jgi:hypothetical protein
MSKSKTQSVESLFGSEEEPSSSSPSSRVLGTALNGEADERLASGTGNSLWGWYAIVQRKLRKAGDGSATQGGYGELQASA